MLRSGADEQFIWDAGGPNMREKTLITDKLVQATERALPRPHTVSAVVTKPCCKLNYRENENNPFSGCLLPPIRLIFSLF